MSDPVISVYGRLASDPRSHETASGKAMTTGSLAVTLTCRDEPDGVTWWLSLVAFGRQADELARCSKGDMTGIAGRLQMSRWHKDGETREQQQVVVDSIVSARTVRPSGKRSGNGTTRPDRKPQPPQSEPTADYDDAIPF